MEKYLFTDGTNVIREAESREELQSLILSSADPAKIRIWIFNTSEWVSLADFNKRLSNYISPARKTTPIAGPKTPPKPPGTSAIRSVIEKILIGVFAAVAIFLIYNFTKVTWFKVSSQIITAERPVNTPPIDIDSLITAIESQRGQKLDKVTRTNLRIRNTWPDLLQLQLIAGIDSSREGLRYYDLELSIDNSTGYNIDNAVVKLDIWKDHEVSSSDTINFSKITYSSPAKRKLEGMYRGDSISVSFESIRAKSFNFCYSSDKKSNYGNYNDRWYCRE